LPTDYDGSTPKEMMRGPTKKQLSLLEQIDRVLSVEKAAVVLGKSISAVKRQLALVRRRVRDGHFSPAPLPIELAARIHRIYLAGFDVFRPGAVAYGEHLKALCREHGFVGIYPLDGNAPPSLTPNEKGALDLSRKHRCADRR
jgi:Nucleoside 2-deoxyribosyltransferase